MPPTRLPSDLTTRADERSGAPHPELVAAGDLAEALRAIGDLPAHGLVVAVEAPAGSPLREFLLTRARRSGGWLNRGWALGRADVPALGRVARSCGPLPARVFRHDVAPLAGEAPGDTPVWLWVTLDHDRRRPPEPGGAA